MLIPNLTHLVCLHYTCPIPCTIFTCFLSRQIPTFMLLVLLCPATTGLPTHTHQSHTNTKKFTWFPKIGYVHGRENTFHYKQEIIMEEIHSHTHTQFSLVHTHKSSPLSHFSYTVHTTPFLRTAPHSLPYTYIYTKVEFSREQLYWSLKSHPPIQLIISTETINYWIPNDLPTKPN